MQSSQIIWNIDIDIAVCMSYRIQQMWLTSDIHCPFLTKDISDLTAQA